MRLIFAMPGNGPLARQIAALSGDKPGMLETRRFPDGESYVRVASEVAGLDAAIVCTLGRPDRIFLRLLFTARALKELGVRSVVLIAPYLAYMRQDIRFRAGEALTSRHFAELISREFDGLITIDPHLHRYKSLGDIFAVPAIAVHSAPLLGEWIGRNVENPLIVGPDAESEQWISRIAAAASAPYAIFEKNRSGDRSVEMKAPDLAQWEDRRPVLVDDVISSGSTILAAALCLRDQGFGKPACIAVHALFPEKVHRLLDEATSDLISTDSIRHPTNAISLAALLSTALNESFPVK